MNLQPMHIIICFGNKERYAMGLLYQNMFRVEKSLITIDCLIVQNKEDIIE